MKTAAMTLALASVLALGTACFGLFTATDERASTSAPECAGLSGQPKIDCERREGR
jgi:uncharacterized membrane protein